MHDIIVVGGGPAGMTMNVSAQESAGAKAAPATAAPAPAASAPAPMASRASQAPNSRKDGVTAFLFKTPTCPNCKAAGALLDKAGVTYEALNANEEKDLVSAYGVKQAPTLVLVDGDTIEKYRGVSDIKGWLMHKA